MFHDLLLLEVGLFNHKLVAYFLFQVSVYLNIFITNIVKIKTPNIFWNNFISAMSGIQI